MTPLKTWVRNYFIAIPCAIVTIAGLQHIGIPRHIAGYMALGAIPICIAISSLTSFTRVINRHRILAYTIAATSWLICIAHLYLFIYRISR